MDASHEYFVNISFSQREDYLWAKAGDVVATEQFALTNRPALAVVTELNNEALKTEKTADAFTITGKNNSASFNPETGMLTSLIYNGTEMIDKGKGFSLNWYRSINNDIRNYIEPQTKLVDFTTQSVNNGEKILVNTCMVTVLKGKKESTIPYRINYTFYNNGAVDVAVDIDNTSDGNNVPRLGLQLAITPGFENISWYGRGPQENYIDRKASAYFGIFNNTVTGMEEAYVRTQSMGNREDIRWLTLTNGKTGIKVTANDKLNFTALHFHDQDLWTMKHEFNLDKNRLPETILSLDYRQRGLGNASCGPGPLQRCEIPTSANNEYAFRIEPVKE